MSNLAKLNEDCLRIICKSLPICDQLGFAQVCLKFRAVFYTCSEVSYKDLNLNCLMSLSLSDVHTFFIIAGPTIETVNGATMPYIDIVKLICEYCFNVKVLHLQSLNVKDSDILAMAQLPNLEKLSLAQNYHLKGKYLHKLSKLKELNLYACSNMRLDMCTLISLKELEALDIRRCKYFKLPFFETMVKYFRDLATLKISVVDEQYAKVALLPNLKRLVLNFSSSSESEALQHTLFSALVEHKSQRLKFLEILGKFSLTLQSAKHISQLQQLRQLTFIRNEEINDSFLFHLSQLENLENLMLKNCRAITDFGLQYMVQNCHKLKSLNITGCSKITDNFVWGMIELLNTQEKPENQLQLTCINTCISADLVKNPKYLAASALKIKLIFDSSADEPCEDYDDTDSDYFIGHWTNDEVVENNHADINLIDER